MTSRREALQPQSSCRACIAPLHCPPLLASADTATCLLPAPHHFRLDDLNENLRRSQERLAAAEAQAQQLSTALSVSDWPAGLLAAAQESHLPLFATLAPCGCGGGWR